MNSFQCGISPSRFNYGRRYCSCTVPGVEADILVSDTAKNRGKLFYSCLVCKKWNGWCVPYGMDDAPSVSAATYAEAESTMPNPVRGSSAVKSEKFTSLLKTGIQLMILLNLVILCFVLLKYGFTKM